MHNVRPVRVSRTIRWMAGLAAAALLVGGGVALGANLTAGSQSQTSLRLVSSQAISNQAISNQAISNGLRHYHVGRLLLRRLLLRRLIRLGGEHGQITFKTKKGTRTVAFERGLVQSATSSSVVVKAADGTTLTWTLVTKTVVVRAKDRAVTRASASALAVGQRVFVVGAVVGGADNVRLIIIRG